MAHLSEFFKLTTVTVAARTAPGGAGVDDRPRRPARRVRKDIGRGDGGIRCLYFVNIYSVGTRGIRPARDYLFQRTEYRASG